MCYTVEYIRTAQERRTLGSLELKNCMHIQYVNAYIPATTGCSYTANIYSGTSEERTLGTALLSFLRRLSLSRRFMKYFNFITFYITGWNISNVVKFVHELLCKIVK